MRETTVATYLRQVGPKDRRFDSGLVIYADTFDLFERRKGPDNMTWVEFVGHSDATDMATALAELRPGWVAEMVEYQEPPYVASWELFDGSGA